MLPDTCESAYPTTTQSRRQGLSSCARRAIGTPRFRSRAEDTRPVARFDFGQGLSVMKITYSCWPALLLFCFGGCMQVKTCIDDCVIGCRNRCYAEKAWLQNKSCYNDVECKCDFGKGF